jgi:hypothetical protein
MRRYRPGILVLILILILLVVWLRDVPGPAFPHGQFGELVKSAFVAAAMGAGVYFFVMRIRGRKS